MGAEGKPRKRSQTSPSSGKRLSPDHRHPAVQFVRSKYGWLMPCGTSQGRQKTAQELLELCVLLKQKLGARKDVPAYLSLVRRSRGDKGEGEESKTWVPSHCPWGAVPPPWFSSLKAVSQLGAPKFWRRLGCRGPWKQEESLWVWGSACTWLEQSTHEWLNSRHSFPAFIKRHAANNAAISQVEWKKKKKRSDYSIRLLFTVSSREMRSSTFFNFAFLLQFKKKPKNNLLFLKRWCDLFNEYMH